MERYHIFKLGLAILFYATYCFRPMLSKEHDQNFDNDVFYYQGVEGKPGVDFPVLSHIPRTSFTCKNVDTGYYADLETDCQVFHICEENKKISFLCPNGTIFQQSELICEWWFKVNCTEAPQLYQDSAEQLREEIIRKKASRRVLHGGAILRTEEKSTVSKKINKPTKLSRKPVQFQKEGIDTSTKPIKPIKFHESFEEGTTREPFLINESDEAQIVEETASFVKSPLNQVPQFDKVKNHPNHRDTYSDIKEPQYYSTKLYQTISSVTPHYLTTQSINRGRPFVGSQVGSTFQNQKSTTPLTNLFNVGNTDHTIDTVPTTTSRSLLSNITVPRQGSFNIGTTPKPNYATIYGVKATAPTPPTRIRLSLSKSVFGGTTTTTTPKPSSYNSAEILSVADSIHGTPQVRFYGKVQHNLQKSTPVPSTIVPTFVPLTQNGFYVTKGTEKVRPRPFQVVSKSTTNFKSSTKSIAPVTYAPYQISSASPFALVPSTEPTQPTPFSTTEASFEDHVDGMVDVLMRFKERPGLVVPPSVGPQTLHSLAQYFANALDLQNMTKVEVDKERLTELLTQMTMQRYNELFETSTASASDEVLEAQNSASPLPKVRQLAKVFTQALSSYLDNPESFRKVLQEVRPTEPPAVQADDEADDELLNFSDADADFTVSTRAPVRPTWGFILADVKNSIQNENENLQGADSQSFVSQFNRLQETSTKSSTQLPVNHWTSSPNVGDLWKTAFHFDPASINENFGTTESTSTTTAPPDDDSHHEIQYELKSLPQLALNSTQVHGILIDFMNTTRNDTKLQRILAKLNTTQDEFLEKMKEIEGNPLTRRLILLLINECGKKKEDYVEKKNSDLHLVDPGLADDNQDSRALQLLNALYTIASRFGK